MVNSFDETLKEMESAADLLKIIDANDEEMKEEIFSLLPKFEAFTKKWEVSRMFAGTEDKSDAIFSLSVGAGGSEAEDWTNILCRMYMRWAESKGYVTEILSMHAGDDGLKSVTVSVKGPYAYGFLRAENGVHRLIRNSPFDSANRKQTSFSAMEVIPDLDNEVGEIEIRAEDLKVDTFRAGGKGGQHINKVESAVRITHLPTGVIVACQAERSQHKNRSSAMKVLRGKLYELERQKREANFEANYGVDKMQNGFGSQVRTYTMVPYQLVKDERTGFKTSDIISVLDGELDTLMENWLLWSAQARKK